MISPLAPHPTNKFLTLYTQIPRRGVLSRFLVKSYILGKPLKREGRWNGGRERKKTGNSFFINLEQEVCRASEPNEIGAWTEE